MKGNQHCCPYIKGDLLIYKPTRKGIDLDVMSSESDKLVSGKVYRVATIQDEFYVVVEGYTHPGGGIYWTEFERVINGDQSL